MDYKYAVMPVFAWLVAGSVKFVVNYIRFRKEAVNLIGNGGFPSTHTTVISSTVFFIGFTEGIATPMFSLGLAVLMITMFDAMGIRRAVGKHASMINQYVTADSSKTLRERQGHTPIEILGGLSTGFLVAFLLHSI
ncbi:divergent PAP2 family protein [Pelosinus sp. IPA-1]|uniref:divergent PAP2 family protein n=1 Tax=Pelosinus sp. IPA-1 TaxID=3029569 RepID=UPI00243617BC|nr:divergent PAP2 family protein [Pelosinus sp. IPA-1]GMA97554.1 acid phosphatase [Pelosinus sp. IPA-1]